MFKFFLIKVFLFIFMVLALFFNLLWLTNDLGLGGILLVLLVNIINLFLVAVFFAKKKNIVLSPADEKRKVKRVFVFAGVSAICLSSFFFFYSWSLIVGRELTPVYGFPYRFYYEFVILLADTFGPYFSALVNAFVGVWFIFGGCRFITKKLTS